VVPVAHVLFVPHTQRPDKQLSRSNRIVRLGPVEYINLLRTREVCQMVLSASLFSRILGIFALASQNEIKELCV